MLCIQLKTFILFWPYFSRCLLCCLYFIFLYSRIYISIETFLIRRTMAEKLPSFTPPVFPTRTRKNIILDTSYCKTPPLAALRARSRELNVKNISKTAGSLSFQVHGPVQCIKYSYWWTPSQKKNNFTFDYYLIF